MATKGNDVAKLIGWPIGTRTGADYAMRYLVIGAMLALTTTASGALAQDAKRGEHVFKRCLLCHVVEPGATTSIAPPLHNIVGRTAGIVPGFQYSDIMKLAREKGLVWSEEALYQFLDRPEDFMPGTYMAFAGLDEQERKDVIAYLKMITENSKRKAQAEPQDAKPANTGAETSPDKPVYVPSVPQRMLQNKPKPQKPQRAE